jgi:hypothetical protein
MQKIKQFLSSEEGKDILIVLIILLVGLISFGLGRLSKNTEKGDIRLEYVPQEANVYKIEDLALKQAENRVNTQNTSSGQNTASGKFFASNRGKKYYPLNCSAGKSIKIENRIYFDSKEQAEKAGYELSSSCN